MATETSRHRLSPGDAAWLHMDRPTNLLVINSVMLFDERPDEEQLRTVIRTRLVEPFPRFHQRVVESRLPLLGPAFEDDRHFELDRHLHRVGLPEPGDEESLKRLAGDLFATPLDHAKPLWDMYLLDRPGGGAALLVRMHHCIADGIALARVMLSLTDVTPEGDGLIEPPEPQVHARPEGALATATGAVRASLTTIAAPADAAISATRRVAAVFAHEGAQAVAHPREVAGRAAADAQALAKLLFTPADRDSALSGEVGVSRKVAWTRQLDLERVKATAHAQEATVNDVLLAAVSGALRRHLSDSGEEPREIRTFVPVNLRPLEEPIPRELGNRFGLVFLSLPVDVAGRRARLQELKSRMDAIKRTPEGPVSYAILEGVGLTPPAVESRIVDIFTAKASAVMTNVPGPREVVYLAGSPVRAVLVWAPTSGSVGMSVSIFSYRGEVTIGLLVDAGLVTDPQTIMRHAEQELAALGRLKPAPRSHPAAPNS